MLSSIHSNLKYLIYCNALAAGGEKEWEFAWEKYHSPNHTSDRDNLGSALACTTKIWLLNRWAEIQENRDKGSHREAEGWLLSRRYLEYTRDEDKMLPVETISVIRSVAKNVAGHALAWNFMRAHWDDIKHGQVVENNLVSNVFLV